MKNCFNLLLLMAMLSLLGCGSKDRKITSLAGLEGGKIFAVPTGTAADQMVLKKFPDAKLVYLNNILDCALAVKGGKADAAVYDKPVLQNIAAKNGGVYVLPDLIVDDKYGFAVRLSDVPLKTTADGVLSELKANGTYNDMMKRWFPTKGGPSPMPVISFDGSNGVLKFGTAAVTEPMSFLDGNHNIVGFDVEFASYIAKKLNKQLEIIDMEFGAMLPALIAGKVDMIGAGLSITEERAKKVLFTQSYYPSGIAALVRDNAEPVTEVKNKKLTGIDDIKDKRIAVLLGSIHDTYATKNYPKAEIMEYQNVSDMLNGLNSGKVDVGFYDHISLKEIFKSNTSLGVLAANVFEVPIAAGINKKNTQLLQQFNSFLKEIKSNGVYDDMVDRWMNKDLTAMPDIPGSNANGVLRVGIVGDLGMPFSLIKDGKHVGFDIELSTRFAASIGKEFAPVDMPFGSLIASISTDKIDLITASMMITDERKKMINFSDPYFKSGVSVIAQKDNILLPDSNSIKSLEDISDKKIGIFTGTVHDAFVAKKYPKAQVLRYESTADMIMALKCDKVDAAMMDAITARLLLKKNPQLAVLSDDVLKMPLGVGFNKKNPELLKDYNNFLAEIKVDGTYKTIHKRWFEDDAEAAVMPVFSKVNSGKKIVAGVSVDDLPYVAMMNGEYVGFDIEMIRTFANRRHYQLEIITMEFPSLVAALAAGKVDMISDGIAISPERGEQINFSDSYADFNTAVIYAPKSKIANSDNPAVAEDNLPFFGKLKNSIYNNIVREKRYLLILKGLVVTIIISILSAIFGTLIGALICFLRMSKKKYLSVSAKLYISLLRGTPVLVLLMIIYYVVFASVNINPVIVAVIAFGLNFGAYVSEMFRISIESIDNGQKEAGTAGGFTKIQTFIHIIAPQALRRVLPVYKGEFISLVKMTSIVGYIAVQDLTKAGDIIRSRTFDAFFPLIMAAVIYLFLAWLLTRALDYVEFSVEPKRITSKREVEVKS